MKGAAILTPRPGTSSDLNSVENNWSIGGTEVEKVTPITSKDEVWDVVLAAWDTVPQQQVGKLVNSFPNRVTTLLGRHGMKIQKSAKIGFLVESPLLMV